MYKLIFIIGVLIAGAMLSTSIIANVTEPMPTVAPTPTQVPTPDINSSVFYSGVYAGCIAAISRDGVELNKAVDVCNAWTQSLDDVDLFEKFYEPPPAVRSDA